MKKVFYLLGFLVIVSCSSTKALVHYQVTLETGNLKPNHVLTKPLYQKEDNQCGALFLEGNDLTVINNFDTSQTFINIKYKYEKNSAGLYSTYTFEDVFLKTKGRYIVSSPLRNEAPVFEIRKGQLSLLDKSMSIEEKDGSTIYVHSDMDKDGKEYYEIYTIRKTVLSSVTYDRYSFPCE
ncbi:MAG: hypothetical protein AB8B74_13335 [Crocinitomicaceae bacterium]